jgi:cold shock CspA family protein/ribosome-associated translation inhibitor RaiA
MDVPPEIAFRGLEPSDALKERILAGIEDLEEVYDHLVSCRVMVEDTTAARHSGKIYRVRLDIGVPHQTVFVDRKPVEADERRDVYQAVKSAFDIARRRLHDLKEKQRHDVKTPVLPPHGRVVKLLTDEAGVRYGFLMAEDGREIYFHENALAAGLDYEDLDVGTEVRFAEDQGDEGPQASTVALLDTRKLNKRQDEEIPLRESPEGP